MTPDEWREAKALLAESLDLPADRRAAFLDLRCGGNPALRREIEALLAASDGNGFLDGEPPRLPGPGQAIAEGEVLGPYKIERKLAEGGMGEVYQAFDSRLARRVAIKVLPVRLSQDGSALKRFEREAKALAALSHPNILTIFDIGRNGETAFAVTELLTGVTLRQRLARGRLPVATAVDIAVQAARGLAVAHAQGIVHRDLKPENLFVTAGGQMKVLDFGIAAFTAPRDGAESMSLRLTAENAVIGTVGYMSPEQAQGKSCDHRSDLFSLGAVLYEMLAGSPAFPGGTPLEAFLAVINLEPAPLESLCPAAGPQLARLVHRCLDKDPDRRFQSANDLAFHLESLVLAPVTPMVPVAPMRRRRGLLLAGAVACLLLAVGLLIGLLAQQPWSRRELPRFKRLTFRRGYVTNARFAPDGQTIVYSASFEGRRHELFTTRTDSPESRPLGLPSATLHSISPKGEMLIDLLQWTKGGALAGQTLARVALAGGAPRPILKSIYPYSFDWAPGGETFALLRDDEHGTQVEYPRGKSIWRSENETWDLRVAPAGDALAFCEARAGAQQVVVIVDRAGKIVTQSGGWKVPVVHASYARGCVAWAPDGRELWFAAAQPGGTSGLYALTRGGEVRPLLRAPDALALLDVAPDGRALLTQSSRRTSLVARAPGETEERDLSWFDTSDLADLSVDGRWVLFSESGQGGGERMSVYLRGTDGSPAVRLGDGKALALSPDGRWALARSATDSKRLFLLPTGTGEPRALPPTAMDVNEAQWLPGGRQLLIGGTEPGKGFRFYLMDVGAKEARPFLPPGPLVAVPSPDGSRVATADREGVRIYPLGGGEPRTIPSEFPERPIQWRADGQALYLGRWTEGKRLGIDEIDLATGQRRRFKELRLADSVGSSIRTVLMTPGGEAYAYDARTFLSALYLVEGLR